MKEEKKDALQEILERLEQGVKDFYKGDKFQSYLNTLSKFHNYSLNNTLLIAMQKPEASLVAGYNAWKNNFNRQVQKGEKAIKILAPTPYKTKKMIDKVDEKGNLVLDENGKPKKEEVILTVLKFKVVSVFDVSQTEGEPLPQLVESLKGEVHEFDYLFQALKEISPVPISFEDMESAHGYFSPAENRIALKEGESQLQTIKTLIHEIAHAVLHNTEMQKEEKKDRRTKEVEAESVAYVVTNHFGLDTSEYSFGYVAGWSSGRDIKELKGSMEIIKNTSSDLIQKLESKMLEIQMLKSKEPIVKATYKEKVKEEIRQEVKVAGMTIDQNEANRYEAFNMAKENNKNSLLGKLRFNKDILKNQEKKEMETIKKDEVER